MSQPLKQEKIAIVGMAGRFPGAVNLKSFWDNLVAGVESVQFFTPLELQENSLNSDLINNPDFVPAKAYLDQAEYFAADFFKFPPKKAKILDPQFRFLLESVWEAWENAGYNIKEYSGLVGVYTTSSSFDSYWQKNLLQNNEFKDYLHSYDVFISNAKDFLATQIAYQFNFKGPCINIQTACSSSLVAISQACNDLLNDKCDIAVVGAVCITFPLKDGYIYQEGMIYSKDGHCRAFAKDASGIVPGNGGGVVLLKRLSQAELEGDHIFAIIDGYAINNDGHDKLSYAAPSVKGQYEVLVAAARSANIDPNTVGYIEAHGSGTLLGDQVEVKALKQYIPQQEQSKHCCYLGSVKTNIGHLDVAAGMAGFIKTVLALYHKKIPKTLHAEIINPALKLEKSAFQIANTTIDWLSRGSEPRRAGVSSFGIGGTNAHVILEEYAGRAKKIQNEEMTDSWQILPLSAQTLDSLLKKKDELALFLQDDKEYSLANIAHTLQDGRVDFQNRLAVVCTNKEEAFNALYLPAFPSLLQSNQLASAAKSVFLFSNALLGSRELLRELYARIEHFQKNVDLGIKIIVETLQIDLTQFFRKSADESFLEACSLEKDLLIFIVEYALAKYWMFLGVKPNKLVGYGVGEYVAACFAGVFSIADAAKLIALSFEIQQSNNDRVLSLSIVPDHLEEILKDLPFRTIANNAPQNCYIAVDIGSIKRLEKRLIEKNITYERLNRCNPVTVPIKLQSQLQKLVESISFNQANIPVIPSSYIEDLSTNIAEPNYWINRLSAPICYSSVISSLLSQKCNIFIEIGFSDQLCRWAQQVNNFNSKEKLLVVPGIISKTKQELNKELAINLAKIWIEGVAIDWKAWNMSSSKSLTGQQKIPLPTYPFTRQPYLVKAQTMALEVDPFSTPSEEKSYELFIPSWKRIDHTDPSKKSIKALIYMETDLDITPKIIDRLIKKDSSIRMVSIPELPEVIEKTEEWINSRSKVWQEKIQVLPVDVEIDIILVAHVNEYKSFYDLVAFARSLKHINRTKRIRLHVITSGIIKIDPADVISPLSALILGPVFCLPLEHPNLDARCIDINLSPASSDQIDHLIEALEVQDDYRLVALRAGGRYTSHVLPLDGKEQVAQGKLPALQFKKNGVYLITGGLGGIGLVLAEYLAKFFKANLILISRSSMPDRSKWLDLLTSQGISVTLAHQLQSLLKIEKSANQLLMFSADIAEYKAMSKIVSKIKRRFGSITGVIHAASPSPEGMLHDKKIDQIEEMFGAKISGLHVLDKIFNKESLDFMLIFSSINKFYGAAGATDYVSANAYLSAFAHQHAKHFYPLVAIDWDTWKDVGMRYKYLLKREAQKFAVYALGYGKWYPLLVEHKVDQNMVLVGAILVELCIMESHKRFSKSNMIRMKEVSFLLPGIVKDLESFQLISLIKDNNEIELRTNGTSRDKPIFRAILDNSKPELPSFNMKQLFKQFESVEILQRDDFKYGNKGRVSIGPHWDCLTWVKQKGLNYLAKLELSGKFKKEVSNFILHPSLLDVGYSFHVQFMDGLHLPFYIEELVVFHALPSAFYSFIEIKSTNQGAGTCTSDVVLFAEDGTVLLIVKGFVLKRVTTNNIESPPQDPIDNKDGLSQFEGIAALRQIMHQPYPEIVVSKNKLLEKNIADLQVQKSVLSGESQDNMHNIKTLENLPDKIKNIWIKLLGVETVSPQDNFFNLNGDSLLAIEVCYLIKIESDIHIAPNVLLEYPVFADFVLAVSKLEPATK